MSKYTEKEINDAIEVVQTALKDDEIESNHEPHRKWYTMGELSCNKYNWRAKKKPREFWISGPINQGQSCEIYLFNPVETDNEKAAYADRIFTKVREVPE